MAAANFDRLVESVTKRKCKLENLIGVLESNRINLTDLMRAKSPEFREINLSHLDLANIKSILIGASTTSTGDSSGGSRPSSKSTIDDSSQDDFVDDYSYSYNANSNKEYDNYTSSAEKDIVRIDDDFSTASASPASRSIGIIEIVFISVV